MIIVYALKTVNPVGSLHTYMIMRDDIMLDNTIELVVGTDANLTTARVDVGQVG